MSLELEVLLDRVDDDTDVLSGSLNRPSEDGPAAIGDGLVEIRGAALIHCGW
jgi:hypothetical protein